MYCFVNRNVVVALFILGFWFITAYHQDDYKIVHHYVKIAYINPKYLTDARVLNVKPNRTYRAFSGYYCQLVDAGGKSLKLNVHGYTAKSELKDTPLQFDVKLCETLERNLFGVQKIFQYSNITKCPLKKGCYAVNNFVLSENDFPPFIPPDEYVFKFKLFYEGVLAGQIDWRGEVKKKFN